METIYFNSNDEEKIRKVRELCKGAGFRLVRISQADVNKTVGEISGFKGMPRRNRPLTAPILFQLPEMMIMAGISSARMDELLKLLREADASPELKAQVTIHNASWSLYELSNALTQEHKFFGQQRP